MQASPDQSPATGAFLRCLAVLWAVLACLLLRAPAFANDLPRTIEKIKPSVVGIGSYQKTRSPAVVFVGTGFVTGDGRSVITNAHVALKLARGASDADREVLGIIIGRGDQTEFRSAELVATDTTHDLAHLRIGGAPLPALALGDSAGVAEGQEVAFTGFPLGMVLGLHHVTHRAMVSAITPIVMPAMSSGKLDARMVAQLRNGQFSIFQLDGTAYPGNSGSPVYDPGSGTVIGVINMVFVKGLKENAISQPSGITYAIPVRYVHELLQNR